MSRTQSYVLVSLALAGSFLYLLSLPKVIWGDETLQFAFAAYPDLLSAARAIARSIATVNHGQTGAHMLLNVLLLHWFGASYFIFRLPSYLGYLASLGFGYLLLRRLGVSVFTGLLFILLLGHSQINLEQGWEARPYILLEGCVMCFAWAWHRYLTEPTRGFAGMITSGAVGILFHPFFVVYAFFLAAGMSLASSAHRKALRSRLLARPWASLTAVVFLFLLFLALGKFTWFQTQGHDFGFDPYEYIKRDKSVARFMLGTFFFPWSIWVVPLLGLLSLIFVGRRGSEEARALWPAFLVLGATLVLTQTMLTMAVLRSHYWILQRQWVAGNALAFLCAALLVEFALRHWRGAERRQWGMGVLLLVVFFAMAGWKASFNLRVPFTPSVPIEETESYKARMMARKDLTLSEYQAMAHQNLLAGGAVWPFFRTLYEQETLK